ncbi:hypothetical protein Q9L42_000015 (plasmid) [Methylomarinum sp. Ch1-1]|uniref:Uncharacterized protein n=1 Tax=Methylomarinum roseum TaxID=3067653 RepID=A0AAU7NNY8_9GAMM|nr:hypothetical protein [Methylomarinum sp. Ch1-1]MDP4523097.1 hypothetical protein [Methylomarinum sp. Ch1-1]
MDPKTILKTLKEASPFDLFLISFIALPFVFEAWLRILEKLELGLCAMYWSFVIVLLGYIVGVVAMLVGSNREKRREVAKDQIIGYLTANSYKMMTLETIREKINQVYTNDFLNSLPVHFPNEIRRATLKGNKPGLARITEENDESRT